MLSVQGKGGGGGGNNSLPPPPRERLKFIALPCSIGLHEIKDNVNSAMKIKLCTACNKLSTGNIGY